MAESDSHARIGKLVLEAFEPFADAPAEVQAAYAAGVRACCSYIVGMVTEANGEMEMKTVMHSVLADALATMVRTLVTTAEVLIPPGYER